uniref:Major capsid protein n=1 Tax=Pseudomonas phage Touem01 TaxID=3138548 RepID=A0AAU6W1N1_9VIRU
MDFLNNPNTSGLGVAGDMGQEELVALQKSLQAGYGSDMNDLSGGSALRIQSLDTTLQATVQDNQHFALFNALPKPKATAVLDEWTEQSDIGGFLGDSFNDQDGAASETSGQYDRRIGRVKYMTTYRKIPIVLQTQNNIADAVSLETINGSKQLLTSIEFSLFEGNDLVLPKSFQGIRQQIESLGSADHVIDMRGSSLDSIDPITKAAETVFGFGNFGKITDLYLPPSVQTDLNNNLDPAFRVALDNSPNSVAVGTNVRAIQTSYGAIATKNDVFIRDEKMQKVFQLRSQTQLQISAKNVDLKPASFTAVAAAQGGSDSYWEASHAGAYVYWITGVNHNGESQAITAAAVTAVAGGKVTLTIKSSASGTETGYVIYRGRKDGTADITDVREMVKVPKNTGGDTVYVDINREIPGTTCSYALNLSPSDHAIAWRQFLPMMKIPMAAVNSPIIPWLQMICGYLRITKRNQHVVIKNIVPRGAAWKPFG